MCFEGVRRVLFVVVFIYFQQIKQVLTARDRRGRVHRWFGKMNILSCHNNCS